MSARAAWRLISLGFAQVYRYKPGKIDWLANGLPVEGEEAGSPRVKDYARQDVPTCRLSDAIAQIRQRLQQTGADVCVVVNEERVVLGLLTADLLDGHPQRPAAEVMASAPRTYRLSASPEKALDYMRRNQVDNVLVTTTDGQLFGVLKREDLEASTG